MSFTKITDIKKLSIQEIDENIRQLKIEIFKLRIQKETRQKIKSHIFKHKKHKLAQLLTVKTQKMGI